MRLGEILAAARILSTAQIAAALQTQKQHRGRLGTILIRMELVTADQIAGALAKQHSMRQTANGGVAVVPALKQHFEAFDDKALALIPVRTAVEHSILPIAFTRGQERRLIVCFRDPNAPALIAALERRLDMSIVVCVAAELTMQSYLKRYYERKHVDVAPPEFELVDLDHHGVEKTNPGVYLGDSKRKSALREAMEAAQEPAIVLPAVPTAMPAPTPSPSPVRAPTRTSLHRLIADIDAAQQRKIVGDSIMTFLEQRFATGLMFTVKDGLAMGHRGFGGHLHDKDTVAALMLPLNGGILGAAFTSQECWRGDPKLCSSTAQERLFKLFDISPWPSDVIVAPIAIGQRILCLLYAHGDNGVALHNEDVEELMHIVSATNKAFARIIQSKRASTQS